MCKKKEGKRTNFTKKALKNQDKSGAEEKLKKKRKKIKKNKKKLKNSTQNSLT